MRLAEKKIEKVWLKISNKTKLVGKIWSKKLVGKIWSKKLVEKNGRKKWSKKNGRKCPPPWEGGVDFVIEFEIPPWSGGIHPPPVSLITITQK